MHHQMRVGEAGVDAAIMFADLLLPFTPMGLDFEFVAGEGPVVHTPVRTLEAAATGLKSIPQIMASRRTKPNPRNAMERVTLARTTAGRPAAGRQSCAAPSAAPDPGAGPPARPWFFW